MLPVLWRVSNTQATRIAAVAAALSLMSFYLYSGTSRSLRIALAGVIAVAVATLVELGRPYIPPAPLRLTGVEFGTDFDRTEMRVSAPLITLSPARALRIYGLTAIKAPMDLRERV
jgi:hypothetical protein